ncbi:MAG: aminotransferase class III-fold pyridoxal phosphate-dependent enzyme [Rhodobacteraceae bacterium]|nr:aminotransferase class III-fold pyridoxal phosphate-dependent enzyme [Paracoccaceae bacterium]
MSVHEVDTNLQDRALAVIPNGMFGHQSLTRMPDGYPQFFSKSQGTRLWDTKGKSYIDFMSAYGPNLLGYGHPDVEAAMREQMARGDTMTGPAPVMVDLAEALVSMIGHADWAMFCKNGSDVTSMALMVARAHTGRRKILVARKAYHGTHLWTAPNPVGTVVEDRAHVVFFDYNDLGALEEAARQVGDDLAGVFVTSFRHDIAEDQADLDADYARGVRRICDSYGALLIVDEIRAGFRLSRNGSWDGVGVAPDLSCWGKVLGNGQPISALLGSDVCRTAAGEIFVTGSFWFSAVPMAAALETLRIVRESDYLERLQDVGQYFRDTLCAQAKDHGFALRHTGPATMPMVLFQDDPQALYGRHWCRIAMQNGVWLSPYHNMFINGAMARGDIDEALKATDVAFADLKKNWATVQPITT